VGGFFVNNNKNYRIMKFFEATDKSCNGKGYVKIDMRGNRGSITVNVENLSDGKAASEVYLFKNKDEKIKIGPINSKRGRLQRSIVLNGKDEPIENYNICGVVLDDKILMYAPVFMPPQVSQLNVLLNEEEAIAEYIPEPEVMLEIEEEKIIQCEDELEDDLHVNVEPQNDESNQEVNYSYQEINYNYQEENNNVEEEMEINITKDDKESEFVEQCGRVFNNEYERKLFTMLKEFESVKPLAHNIKSMSWWKVTYDENSIYKGFLPYFNQIITTYYPYPMSNHITTCQTLLKKHGYYLFGIYEENGKIAKYVYGVPGKFTRDQQPYRGVTGFKNWSYKSNDIPGDYGYWLAFIDANTGAVSDAPEIE